MKIPIYLAMTAAELRNIRPQWPVAWLSCLFSPYGTGLTNLPQKLPKDAFLILSDRTPVCGHNPQRIAQTLQQVVSQQECRGVLLDFQRPPEALSMKIAEIVIQTCQCPVGITPAYAEGLPCPVLLPPWDLLTSSRDHFSPWEGREIWQEAAVQRMSLKLTEHGCAELPEPVAQPLPHYDETLVCQYGMTVHPDAAVFTLQRTEKELTHLPENVTHLFGLYQELT